MTKKQKKIQQLLKQAKDKNKDIKEDENSQTVKDLHEETDRSKDIEEEKNSIKVHQPNHQNNSPRKNQYLPNNNKSPKPLYIVW